MRLNTRNMVLLAALVVVIAGLMYLNTQDSGDEVTDEPTETAAETGRLFPDADENTINRFEIRELERSSDATEEPEEAAAESTEEPIPAGPPILIMSKDEGGVWTIDEATNSTDRAVDQTVVVGTMGIVAEIDYADRFTLEETEGALSDYGLDEPEYQVLLADDENEYVFFLGNRTAGNARYYARINDDEETVYLLNTAILQNVLDDLEEPPYVPAPTATPTAFPTANPFSEVEQTATAQADFDATSTAIAEFDMTATAVAEEAAEIGPDAPETEEPEATEEPGS